MVPAEDKPTPPSVSMPARRTFARLFILTVLCLHVLFFVDLRKEIAQGYPDFTVYYTAAKMLRNGQQHQLYNPLLQSQVQSASTGRIASGRGFLPYIHPPFEALFFLPLAWLSYAEAFALWTCVNLALLFAVAAVSRKSLKSLQQISSWKLFIASLSFFPVFICFLQGQDSILLLLLCVLAFRALQQKEDFLAGCWLALGLFKFQFMIPIVLLAGVFRKRRAAIGFAAVSAVLLMISIAIVGWQELLRYPAFALQVANSAALGGVKAQFAPNLRGLIMGWPLPFPKSIAAIFVLISSAGLFVFAVIRSLWIRREAPDLQWSLAIIVALLIAWQTNMHDLSLLTLPLISTWDYWRSDRETSSGRIAFLLPILPLLISPLWLVLWLVGHKVNLIVIPLLWWIWEIGRAIVGDHEQTSSVT